MAGRAARHGRRSFPTTHRLLRPSTALPAAHAHALALTGRRPTSPTLAAAGMGCAASTADGAETRRRGWARARALGHSEASTSGLPVPPQQQQGQGQGLDAESSSSSSSGGRRRGCKVAPEPKDLEAALPPVHGPGSPSFRYYCQKTAAVDKIVADTNNSDGSVRVKAMARQLSSRSETTATKAHDSNEVSHPKEGTRWLKFSGLSMVAAAWHNLFNRQRSKSSPPPPAASPQP